MEKLVSNWSCGVSLPETYVFPLEKRPGKQAVPLVKSIPLIDLEAPNRANLIQQILKASKDFGFFQVVNHGVSEELMDDTMIVIKEFHNMPAEDKARESSQDPSRRCKLYTSSENYATEKVHFWRDALVHPCQPLEQCLQFWPEQPATYREVVASYVVEMWRLGNKILGLISEGLGLSPGYLSGELSEKPVLVVNHYPPCPDPSLTLGLGAHRDPSLITILLEGDVRGLQVFKDGEWIGVETIHHAFLVNVGYFLQIVSNGKLKGVEHRVVTNSSNARTTASYFIYPLDESVVEPAKPLIDEKNLPLYRSLKAKDFLAKYVAFSADAEVVQEFVSLTK